MQSIIHLSPFLNHSVNYRHESTKLAPQPSHEGVVFLNTFLDSFASLTVGNVPYHQKTVEPGPQLLAIIGGKILTGPQLQSGSSVFQSNIYSQEDQRRFQMCSSSSETKRQFLHVLDPSRNW